MSDFWVRGALDGQRDAERMYRLGWRAPERFSSIEDGFIEWTRELARQARGVASAQYRERLAGDADGLGWYALDTYAGAYRWALDVEMYRLTFNPQRRSELFDACPAAVLRQVAAVLSERASVTDVTDVNEGDEHS